MNEKFLIQSERYNIGKIFKRVLIISLALTMLVWVLLEASEVLSELGDDFYDRCYEDYAEHEEQGYCYESNKDSTCWDCELIEEYPTKTSYAFRYPYPLWPFLLIIAGLSLVCGLIYLCLRSYELTVTDKRIYGKVAWGKRIDLPVDAVSATGYLRGWKGVTISTASGKISFRVIKNAEEIYSVVNNLLIERQNVKAAGVSGAASQSSDSADQLKKYKELLDAGVITQEEFDAKKKQLLDL